MNPLMILKGAKVFVIAGVVLYGLMMGDSFLKDQREVRNNLITVNAEKVSAEARAQTLANANAQLEEQRRVEEEFRKETVAALGQLNATFTEIRREQQSQKIVLEGDRLNRLGSGRKQDRIEALSNAATRDRFDSVEEIFDGL